MLPRAKLIVDEELALNQSPGGNSEEAKRKKCYILLSFSDCAIKKFASSKLDLNNNVYRVDKPCLF